MNPNCGRILQHYFGFIGKFWNKFIPPYSNAFVIKKGISSDRCQVVVEYMLFLFWKKGIRETVETQENVMNIICFECLDVDNIFHNICQDHPHPALPNSMTQLNLNEPAKIIKSRFGTFSK